MTQTADRRPQTADRRPQTADRRPQTADLKNNSLNILFIKKYESYLNKDFNCKDIEKDTSNQCAFICAAKSKLKPLKYLNTS